MASDSEDSREVEGRVYDVPLRDGSSSVPGDGGGASSRQGSGVASHHGSEAASHQGSGVAWAPMDDSAVLDTANLVEEETTATDVPDHTKRSIQKLLANAANDAGSSALFGSLELLKIAGGLTLSTTGVIMSPSIKVTQQVILPALWAATYEYLRSITPQRVKDWARIVASSIYHLYSVLRNTHSGEQFRSRLVTVGADIVECVSSDASRQVITDGMAAVVKLAEALHTPEFRSFLDHLNIVGARLVDAAASGRNKQLMTDTKAAIWSAVELAADPESIVAFAEVTATLCHTLEMEENLHRRGQTSQRRQERNQFTQQAYLQPHLTEDPDVTVEQSIMSALGGVEEESRGPPRNVTVQPRSQAASTTGSSLESDWKQAGRDKVDSSYLEQQIRRRSEQKDQERMLRTTITTTGGADLLPPNTKLDSEELDDEIEDLVVESVFEDDDDEAALRRQGTMKTCNSEIRSKQPLAYEGSSRGSPLKYDTSGVATPATVESQESEPAVARFYRVLDDILAKKRAEGLDEFLQHGDALRLAKGLALTQRPSGEGPGSIKESLAALHRAALDGDVEAARKLLGRTDKVLQKHSVPQLIMSLIFVSTVFVWFGFGCYGMYVVFRSSSIKNTIGLHRQLTSSPSLHGTQEVVVRILREVVHVDQDGKTIDFSRHAESPIIDMDKVTECFSKTDL